MATSKDFYDGRDFLFEPENVDIEDFKDKLENPAAGVNKKIIKEVVAEITPAFEEEGVPAAVIDLLKKLWIQKLEMRHESLGQESDESFHGFDEPTPSTSGAARPASLKKSTEKMQQLDGTNDSSDSDEEINEDIDDDDDNDSDDDDDDDIDGEDEDAEGEGAEDDPLGSGDDISDGDPSDLFNTENVVVCQYDKIQRVRNKWKFHLKDGIMNLNGKDYVFQKATGEAEW